MALCTLAGTISMPLEPYEFASEIVLRECEALIFSYIQKRKPRAIVLLLDIRRDIDEREERIVNSAQARGIDVLLVLTKSDKLAVSKRAPAKKKVALALNIDATEIILHSTHDDKTTRMLKKAVFNMLDSHQSL